MVDGNGFIRFDNSPARRREYRGFLRGTHHVGPGHIYSVVGYLVDSVDKIQDRLSRSPAPAKESGEVEELRARLAELELLVKKIADTPLIHGVLSKRKRGRPRVNKAPPEES